MPSHSFSIHCQILKICFPVLVPLPCPQSAGELCRMGSMYYPITRAQHVVCQLACSGLECEICAKKTKFYPIITSLVTSVYTTFLGLFSNIYVQVCLWRGTTHPYAYLSRHTTCALIPCAGLFPLYVGEMRWSKFHSYSDFIFCVACAYGNFYHYRYACACIAVICSHSYFVRQAHLLDIIIQYFCFFSNSQTAPACASRRKILSKMINCMHSLLIKSICCVHSTWCVLQYHAW